MSQPLVLCLRNAFDITIRQIIKSCYRLQQLELRFVLQMGWCITHHIRAQYIEATLQYTEMKYFLSFGVPAEIGIAKHLIEADDIGRKAVADCGSDFRLYDSSDLKTYLLMRW